MGVYEATNAREWRNWQRAARPGDVKQLYGVVGAANRYIINSIVIAGNPACHDYCSAKPRCTMNFAADSLINCRPLSKA